MKIKYLLIVLLVWVLPAQAQFWGSGFSNEIQILADGAAARDSMLVDSVSQEYTQGWKNMQIHYTWIDTTSGSSGTTLYFETILKGKLKNEQYIVVDSTAVDSSTVVAAGMTWATWNIRPDSTNWAIERWRLRKSTANDSLIAIFKGSNQ